MTTLELIEEFIQGATTGKASGGRLYIDGSRLINYGTCIAEADEITGNWLLNMTKYSPTTSKHQNRVKRILDDKRAFQVTYDDIPQGTMTLV